MVNIVIYANVVFLMFLIFLPFKKNWHSKTIVFVWTAFNILYSYYLGAIYGFTESTFRFIIDFEFPFYSALFSCLLILLLPIENKLLKPIRLLVMFALVVMMTNYTGSLTNISAMAEGSSDVVLDLVYLNALILAFTQCVLATLTIWTGDRPNIYKALFYVSPSHLKKHLSAILLGVIGVLLLYLATGLIQFGRPFYLRIVTPFPLLINYIMLSVFFFTLVKHLVCFALAKYVLDELFKRGETTLWEIVVYALIFVIVNTLTQSSFYLPHQFLMFIYGLLYSYMYIKTKSLFYGIALSSILIIFAY